MYENVENFSSYSFYALCMHFVQKLFSGKQYYSYMCVWWNSQLDAVMVNDTLSMERAGCNQQMADKASHDLHIKYEIFVKIISLSTRFFLKNIYN